MVSSSWSRFVLAVWMVVVLILIQSYVANLSAMLTVDQLGFEFSQDSYIGHQEGSFVRKFLIKHLNISESQLRQYSSIEQYDDGLSKGGKNGGIDAIVDEVPYMKLLLNRYGSKYKMLGPRYRTDGLGFAFPKGSPLVVHFSRAILAVTEGPNLTRIEEMNFGPGYSSENQLDSTDKQTILTAYYYVGLFSVIVVVISALCFSETSVGAKLISSAAVYGLKCFSFLQFIGNYFRSNSTVHPSDSDDSFSKQEVPMSEQFVQSSSATPDTDDVDHQSGQRSSHVSYFSTEISYVPAEVKESDRDNP